VDRPTVHAPRVTLALFGLRCAATGRVPRRLPRLPKFRLCRAFREQVGLPPHAYVTHRRVSLAQELLAAGVPQAEVAFRVGLYDQSQLHRHFKRLVGVTPGEWARAMA